MKIINQYLLTMFLLLFLANCTSVSVFQIENNVTKETYNTPLRKRDYYTFVSSDDIFQTKDSIIQHSVSKANKMCSLNGKKANVIELKFSEQDEFWRHVTFLLYSNTTLNIWCEE